MKKNAGKIWLLAAAVAAVCGMLIGCGGIASSGVSFRNAASWGYFGGDIWLFRDGALKVCADPDKTPKGEQLNKIPREAVRSVYTDGRIDKIGYEMFRDCTDLTSVELPNVTVLGRGAFSGCAGLTDAVLPDVAAVSGDVFEGCDSLTSVELPGVAVLERSPFGSSPTVIVAEWEENDTFPGHVMVVPNVTKIGEKASFAGYRM